jgi:hypothetical protein
MARFRSGIESLMMARAQALAIILALLVVACGTGQSTSGAPESGSPALQSATASSTVLSPAVPSGSPGTRCGDSHGSRPEPQYAFPHVSFPLGSDACQDIGPFTHPKILYVTNDGSAVSFVAADADHEGYVWYGDLTKGPVKVVYQAQQTTSNRSTASCPQLAGGQLVWLEYVHEAAYASTPVRDWAVKDMDLATGTVKVVAHGFTPGHGGPTLVNEIRFDGKRIAMSESVGTGWQIEIRDLAGNVQSTIAASADPFDLALVNDGLLYSTGTENPGTYAVGQMHFWHWTPGGGSAEIGADVFQINGEGDLAAWVSDPLASKNTTGNPQQPRLYVATAPFTNPRPISPVVSATGSKGIDGMAVGSGAVAWWEKENWNGTWQDVLTLWQVGWQSPIQVDTEGNESYRVSLKGGWLVWAEEFGRDEDPLMSRIRGVPLAVLASQSRLAAGP